MRVPIYFIKATLREINSVKSIFWHNCRKLKLADSVFSGLSNKHPRV